VHLRHLVIARKGLGNKTLFFGVQSFDRFPVAGLAEFPAGGEIALRREIAFANLQNRLFGGFFKVIRLM